MKTIRYCFTTLILCSLAATWSRAADRTWTGGGAPDGNWQTAANWGGNAPVARDALFFDGSTQLFATNNFSAGTIFGGVTFNSGASAFTFAGNGLVITNAAQDVSSSALSGGGLSTASASDQTNNCAITLSAGNHAMTTGSGAGALYQAGAFTRNAGATVQFTKSGGNLNFTGSGLANDSSDSGGILGGWAVIGLGSNLGDWATLTSGNAVAYSGYTSKAGNTSWALSSSGGDVTRNIKITDTRGTATLNTTTSGTYDINTILWNRGAGNPAGDETLNITSGQILRLGANGGILTVHAGSRTLNIGNGSAGTLTAGGAANTAGEISLVANPIDDKNQRLKVNTVIADNGTGAVKVNVLGWIEIKQNSTYSGGTYINKGRAQVTSVATGTQTGFGTGPVYVFPGAQAFIWDNSKANVVVTNDFFIAGYGTSEDKGGALRLTGNGISYTGNLTLMGDAAIAGNATFTGKITGNAALLIGDNWNNGTVVFSNTVPNDYTGDTTINNPTANGGNLIRIGGATLNNIMPHGAGKGNVILTSASGGTWGEFDLNGSTQTLNGLSSSGANSGNTWVESGAAGGVLVVGDNNTSSTFGGVLRNNGGTLAVVKIGTGTFTPTGGQVPNAYTGSTTISNGVLALSGTATISNSVTINVVSGATLDVSGLGSWAIGSAQTLGGNGVVTGAVTAASGGIISPGASAGTINFANSLSLDAGSVCFMELSTTTNGANDRIAVAGNLTLNGGTIQISAGTLQVGRYKLITYGGTKTGTAAANLVLSYAGGQSIAFDDSIAGQIDLIVSPAPVPNLTWAGDGIANVWDLATTTNWLKGVTPVVFSNNVIVTFNDSGSKSPAVNITTAVQPLSLLVSNNTGTYTFSGSGGIAGGATLTKKGAGTLVLSESGDTLSGGLSAQAGTVVVDNDSSGITGGTAISNNATLKLGNASANGILPSGTVINNGTLIFNRTDDVTVGNTISGAGTLVKQGANIVTLSAINTHTGGATIAAGVLRGWTDSALGAPGVGTIVVSNGATLDRGWGTVGPIIVSGDGADGNGAIVNNSSGNMVGDWVGGMTTNLTLTGDTLFGGNTRWDLGNSSGATLNTGGSNYNLTINLNSGAYIEWQNVTIDTNLGNIELMSESLGIKGCGGSLGNPTNTITVHPTSTLTFWGSTSGNSGYSKRIRVMTGATLNVRETVTPFLGSITLEDGGSLGIFDSAAQKDLAGPITLNGLVHFLVGDTTQTISGVIGGTGGFYLDNYNNTLVFTATNTYSGVTDIRAGRVLSLAGNGSISSSSNIILAADATLIVTNRVDGTLTLATGQTLSGNGRVRGNLFTSPGSIVSPGASTGALSVTNGNVTLGGTMFMELDQPAGTNDVLAALDPAGSINYGGTLSLTNLGVALTTNDVFKLFSAASYSGAFTSITPATPGAGLVWNTNTLTSDGTLRISAPPSYVPPTITAITKLNGSVILSGTNNVGAGGTYQVLTATNVTLPLVSWNVVTNGTFDANGNFTFTNAVNGDPKRFFILLVP